MHAVYKRISDILEPEGLFLLLTGSGLKLQVCGASITRYGNGKIACTDLQWRFMKVTASRTTNASCKIGGISQFCWKNISYRSVRLDSKLLVCMHMAIELHCGKKIHGVIITLGRVSEIRLHNGFRTLKITTCRARTTHPGCGWLRWRV